MKVLLTINSDRDIKKFESLLKKISRKKVTILKAGRPMESLIAFAEKNAFPVDRITIPERGVRNDR